MCIFHTTIDGKLERKIGGILKTGICLRRVIDKGRVFTLVCRVYAAHTAFLSGCKSMDEGGDYDDF